MEFLKREVEFQGKKRLIKVDENNQPTGEPDIVVNLIKDEGEVYKTGTPLTAETFQKINWRDDKSLAFKNLEGEENLPENEEGTTKIVATNNGKLWIIPSTEAETDSFKIEGSTVLFTQQTLTEQQKLQVRENIGAESNGVTLGETETSAYYGNKGKEAYDLRHIHNNKNILDETQESFTTALKANYNEAFFKKHTHENNILLDTYNQTNADLASAVINKHSHSNKAILDNTEQSFTTALKNKLDGIAAGAQVNPNLSGYPLFSNGGSGSNRWYRVGGLKIVTAIVTGSSGSKAVTWSQAFGDANYVVTHSSRTTSTNGAANGVHSKSTTGCTVTVANSDGAEVHAIGWQA